MHAYNGVYSGDHLNRIAFPMGGMGAGMICLEGTGALSHVSLRHHPEVFHEPMMFSSLYVANTDTAKVLEGPVPQWKVFGAAGTGNGSGGKTYGLPRFRSAEFRTRFPFAEIALDHPDIPLRVTVTGWSPFVPGDSSSASMPVAGLEYRFRNSSCDPVDAVYSFHAANFLHGREGDGGVEAAPGGFVLRQRGTEENPALEGAFTACVDAEDVRVNHHWFRGGWFDPRMVLWREIAEGKAPAAPPVTDGPPSPGGSLFIPIHLEPGEETTVTLRLAWYVPRSDLHFGEELDGTDTGSCGCSCKKSMDKPAYGPWYAAEFASIEAVTGWWGDNYNRLRSESLAFSDCFYDTDLPGEVVEAVAANLTILKSPTVLRQDDGRLWCWEGCCDGSGCCAGSCTHVWNYAQALCHLFPDLERSLRQTEFWESQDERGHQKFRASLPIRPCGHEGHAASDGQLGGVMKVYREWRISGDTDWLKGMWPRVRQSLSYCISTWDPGRNGVLSEPHHNTYDIEFWGPDGMCSSFYLGALKAAAAMAGAVGDDSAADKWQDLLAKGREYLETKLYNGEYFFQDVQWKSLNAWQPYRDDPGKLARETVPEETARYEEEGPKYQYGTGCISDGVLGDWLAEVCGVGGVLDSGKVSSHLLSVHKHNLKRDLSEHANMQRPTYAVGAEGGLLLCSWPKGGKPILLFVYSDEVWTGIEYQVAAHLMLCGHVDEGLEIVRVCRNRYDGRWRNPFNEYECGHWYARAMASYAMLQGLTGARYDAVEKVLYLRPSVDGDFRAFLSTATGYGTVGVRDGKPFFDVKHGTVDVKEIRFDR